MVEAQPQPQADSQPSGRFPTGTVTLLTTQVDGAAGYWDALGDRFEEHLEKHRDIVRAVLATHEGVEVSAEGERLFAAFSRASDAIRCAIEIDSALHQVMWPIELGEFRVCVGCHTGEPTLRVDQGRAVYSGLAATRAVELAKIGHGGQILATDATYRALEQLPERVQFTDLGRHRTGELDRPVRLWQVLPEARGDLVFPPLRAETVRANNLPVAQQSFVGRRQELGELADLILSQSARLVTVIGPGGTGKTRTTLQLGRRLLDDFTGGCWYVDLTSAHTLAEICHAVASALGVPLTVHDSPEKSVANMLEYSNPMLLLIDNFEQVVEHAEKTIGYWRSCAPHVTFVVTSRIVLGLTGEQEYELGPLPIPQVGQSTEDVTEYDCVQLFVDRAREVQRDFKVVDENSDDIARICSELEGMPLALELAAARVKILKPKQIAERLNKRFQILKSSRKELPARQRSLLGAIDWSYDILDECEKSAFMQTSVFRGGFFLEDAEEVIDIDSFDDAPLVMDMIQELREKSLLTAVETDYGLRFNMYVSIREYALEKRKKELSTEDHQKLCERHARYYVEASQEWCDALETGGDALENLERLRLERENLYIAFDSGIDDAELRARALLNALPVCLARGPMAPLVPRLEKALPALGEEPSALQARVLLALSEARGVTGPWEDVLSFAERAVQVGEASGDDHVLADARLRMSMACIIGGDAERGSEILDTADELYRKLGHQRGIGVCLRNRGNLRWRSAELDEAVECFSKSVEIGNAIGDPRLESSALNGRGLVFLQKGRLDEALDCFQKARELARQQDDRQLVPLYLSNEASVYWHRGDYDTALNVYLEAEGIARELGDKVLLGKYLAYRGTVYMETDELESALECFESAEEIAKDMGRVELIGRNSQYRGDILIRQGKPREALECYQRAAEILEEMRLQREVVLCLNGQARASSQLGDANAAVELYEKSEVLARQIHDKNGLADSLAGRAQLFLDSGRAEEAREIVKEVVGLYDEMDVSQTRGYFNAQSTLARAEQNLGNTNAARDIARNALNLAQTLGLQQSGDEAVQTHISMLETLRPKTQVQQEGAAYLQATRMLGEDPPAETPAVEATQMLPEQTEETAAEPAAAPAQASSEAYGQDPLVGKQLGGFEVLSVLGRGAMGSVYKARQISVDRFVALKTILPEFFQDKMFVERFRREARTVAKFRSPHVVQIFEINEQQGIHYLVMEFVDGGDIGAFAADQPDGRLTVRQGTRFLTQCVEALEESEDDSVQVIHRDIKPANLLLDRGRTVKITDFGIAKLKDATMQLTATQQMMGTPLYMSPEQCRALMVDHRSDMYCLGATFFHLLTGKPPVEGNNFFELLHAKDRADSFNPCDVLGEEIPAALGAVIQRMTKRLPEERYASFSEVREALEDL